MLEMISVKSETLRVGEKKEAARFDQRVESTILRTKWNYKNVTRGIHL